MPTVSEWEFNICPCLVDIVRNKSTPRLVRSVSTMLSASLGDLPERANGCPIHRTGRNWDQVTAKPDGYAKASIADYVVKLARLGSCLARALAPRQATLSSGAVSA
jgi:hypothetical protein